MKNLKLFAAILLNVVLIAAYIFILIKYGNMPVAECPVWVAWLLR